MLSFTFLLCSHSMRWFFFEVRGVSWSFELWILFRKSRWEILKCSSEDVCAGLAKGWDPCPHKSFLGKHPVPWLLDITCVLVTEFHIGTSNRPLDLSVSKSTCRKYCKGNFFRTGNSNFPAFNLFLLQFLDRGNETSNLSIAPARSLGHPRRLVIKFLAKLSFRLHPQSPSLSLCVRMLPPPDPATVLTTHWAAWFHSASRWPCSMQQTREPTKTENRSQWSLTPVSSQLIL